MTDFETMQRLDHECKWDNFPGQELAKATANVLREKVRPDFNATPFLVGICTWILMLGWLAAMCLAFGGR